MGPSKALKRNPAIMIGGAAAMAAASAAVAQETTTYSYDDLGRLIHVDYNDGTLSKYDYDPAGNRTQVQQGGMPVAHDDDNVNVAEDTAQDIDVLANDEDLNGDPLSIASAQNGANGSTSIVQVNGVDWVRYTPNANFNGQDSFTYTATDGTAQSTATVTVNVIADNDPPNAVNDSTSTNEDTAKTFDPRSNDSDPEASALTITTKTNGSKGTVAIINNGTQLRYTPNANANGGDSFTYTVSDGQLTDTATVTMTINAVNDAPVAANDSISTNEDTQKTFDPRNNDTDVETPNTSLTITGKTNGSKGTVAVINSGTQLRYTPNANVSGADSFTYTISDGGLSDTATVSVTINAVNDAPNAVNDSKSVGDINVLTFDPRVNDTDVETPNTSLTITAKTNGSKGTVAIVNGGTQLRYTPNGTTGSDSFTYTISDGQLTDTATVNMTIYHVNQAPNAVNDSFTGVNKTVWTTLDVKANDSDPDQEAFWISSTSGSQGEREIINNGQHIRFRCLSGCGSDAVFSYTISDGQATDTASVYVTFGGGGFPPF